MEMNKMEEETSDSLSRQIYLPEDSLDGTYLICDSSDVWGFKFKDICTFNSMQFLSQSSFHRLWACTYVYD